MRGLERTAALLSLAAGMLHVWAGPAHVEEWWAYGLFFYSAAATQAGFGLLLLTQGIEGWGGWVAVRRKVYVLGAWGNLAIVALWVVSRTVGVPVGPEAFEREGLGAQDLTTKTVELALIALLVRLMVLDRAARKPAPRPVVA